MSDEARSEPMTSGSDEGEEKPPNGSEEDDETTKDPVILKKKATRTLKIFRQIAECLEKDVVVEIKQILSEVMSISKAVDVDKEEKLTQVDKEEQLTQVYLSFLDKVEFRAGISVNLIAQAIRCFMMIEEDTEGLGKTVSEMYLEMIVTDHPSLAIDMQLTDELLKVYFKLLDEGYEEMQHIRLMVVGMFGVGKTTLVRRLCRKPTNNVKSTEGIDIFLDLCEVKEDLDWEISDPQKKDRYLNLRLQELITKYGKQDKKSDTSPVARSHGQRPTTTAKMPSNEKPEFEDFRVNVARNDQKTENKIVKELKKIAKKEEEPLKRRPTVSIWDFAGQSVYYSTHHFFLNARSVYILVLDLSKGLHDKVEEDNTMNLHQNLNLGSITQGYTCLETFKFWMKSIYIYTKQKKASLPDNQKNEYKPKIILVGTFKDKISLEKLKGRTAEKYKADYFIEALSSFEETPIMDLIHEKFFLISNKTSDEKDLLSIKKEIYNISKGMPFWNEKVPAKFIPLERAVFQRKQLNKNTMKFSKLKEVGHNLEYPNTDQEVELFLSFQHAFGNVLYYNLGAQAAQNDMSYPSEVIILTPQWIINVFKAFVTHKDEAKKMDRLESWRIFEYNGKLQNDLIDVLLQQNNFLKDKDKILMYMEYLDVIVKPVVFRAEKDKDSCSPSEVKYHFLDSTMKTQTKEEDFYIMPCMLPPRPEMDKLKQLYKEPDEGTHYTPTLCIYIKKGLLPAFVIHRLVATAMKEIPIAWSKGTKLLFNGLGSFKLTEKRILTIWSMDNIIHLRVTFKGACKEEKDEIAFCKALRGRFEELVLEVFNFHGKYTYGETNKEELFKLHVKCPGCDEQIPFDEKIDLITNRPVDYMIGLHSVENFFIVKDKEKTCRCCNKVITAEQALKYWFAIDQQPVDTGKFTQQLGMEVKCCQLVDLAKEIPPEALRRLSQELEISDTIYEHIKQNNPENCRLVYCILYDWKKRGDCWKMLYDAMKRAELKTEHFSRIIQGEDSTEIEKTINKYMEQIKKEKDYVLELTDNQIGQLSDCFGNDYWFFGLRLGIEHTTMERIASENKYENIQNQIKTILNVWKKENEPIRKFIRAVVLGRCDWSRIKNIL